MSASSLPPSQSAPVQKSARAFDFTKKRRWGDLVVAETVEAIAFMVNSSMSVLWCGAAVSDVLGWREADFLDCDLTEYMNEEDHEMFRAIFEGSLESGAPFGAQVRMKVNPPSGSWQHAEHVLVEFEGIPEITKIDGEDMMLVFLYAKQGRTIPTIQAYPTLEMERLALQRRLSRLQNQTTPEMLADLNSSRTAGEASTSFYSSSNLAAQMPENENTPESKTKYRGLPGHDLSPDHSTTSPSAEEEPEEGLKKRKSKKSNPSEHHVCVMCGQTESPEWRKGPLGPKTLCNACGLRWAKQSRKPDESEAAAVDSPPK